MTRADVIKKWVEAHQQSRLCLSSETEAACINAAGMEWAAMRAAQIAIIANLDAPAHAVALARDMMED